MFERFLRFYTVVEKVMLIFAALLLAILLLHNLGLYVEQ